MHLQPTRRAAWACTLTKTFILVYKVDLLDRCFESPKKFVKGKSLKGKAIIAWDFHANRLVGLKPHPF